MSEPTQSRSMSIICVFNDHAVREQCLDRSIEHSPRAPGVIEYIPVDNVDNQFSSAGAALNHGAKLARGDILVFAHQDVYLHSLRALQKASTLLSGDSWGLLGASGITASGTTIGRMRDRVVLTGVNAVNPVDVDSLDEVLFMARREVLLEHPLSEAADLAWHAYAVEYGLRLREFGLKTGAMNLNITHNSLTENLARLDVAHQFVGNAYRGNLPLRTTCGTIGGRSILPEWGLLGRQRWRYRWLRESLVAWQVRRSAPGHRAVLSDIRLDVDLLPSTRSDPLQIINLDRAGGFTPDLTGPLTFSRGRGKITVRSAQTVQDVIDQIAGIGTADSVLVTNLGVNDVGEVIGGRSKSGADVLIGYHEGTGVWLLAGPAAAVTPVEWSAPRAVPVGMRA